MSPFLSWCEQTLAVAVKIYFSLDQNIQVRFSEFLFGLNYLEEDKPLANSLLTFYVNLQVIHSDFPTFYSTHLPKQR